MDAHASDMQAGSVSAWRSGVTPLLTGGVLVVGVLATLLTFGLVSDQARQRNADQFADLCERTENRVREHFALHEYGLSGLRGAFVASDELTSDDLRRYVESRDIAAEFPGATSFGLLRRSGPEGVVQPEGEGPGLIVAMVQEMNGGRGLLGLDLSGSASVRAAAVRAAEGGRPAISGRVEGVPGLPQGTLVFVAPMFRGQSGVYQSRRSDPSDRAEWVFCTIDAVGLLGRIHSEFHGLIDFRIRDAVIDSPDRAIFDSKGLAAGASALSGARWATGARELEIAEHPWTIEFAAGPNLPTSQYASTGWLVLCGGFVCSLLLAGLVHSLGVRHRIAARMAAEMTMQLSESESHSRRLALVASRTTNMVVITDAKGRVQWVNEGFIRGTGYSFLETVGRSPGELLQGPETSPETVARMREAVARGEGFCVEVVNYTKDRRTYWVQVDAQPVYENGELTGFIAIETDISERKHAEERLRSSEELLRRTGDLAMVGGWELDLTSGRLIWSDTVFRIHALEPGTPPGVESAINFYAPEARITIRQALQDAIEHGKPFDLELPFVDAAGVHKWVRSIGIPEFSSDRCVRLTGAFQDITLEREAKQELERAKDSAEAANRSKSAFLANMSHEIRTPMTAIIGFADLVADDQIPAEQRCEAARTIRRNGEHLLSIINDILDLSKIEAGKMQTESIECSPATIVEEIISLMSVRTRSVPVVLRSEVEYPLPARVQTDPVRLRQILVNLVGNAIKFTNEGEIVVRLRAEREGNACRLHFEVADSGIGMTPEQLERLFKPFSQADDSTTRRFGGTGLGLTISRRLANLLNGELSVTSRPGEGSTFTLCLTLPDGRTSAWADSQQNGLVLASPQDRAERGGARPSEEATDLSGVRVLVAEDGPDNQRLLMFHLRQAGAQVQVASDGVEAVELVRAAAEAGTPYGVILMDMQMPRMDGYDATVRIREEGFNSPVIALTAHAMTGDRERCLGVGCDDYLTKPIDRERLIRCVRGWAESGRSAHAPA